MKMAYTFALLVVSYPLAVILYNILSHSLSRFPDSKLWIATRLPFIWSTLIGDSIHRNRKMHEIYDNVVRVALDEISFANA